MSKSAATISQIRLLVNAGQAKPAPPVGPALGQAGLKIMDFCKDFNAKTASMRDDVPVPVVITPTPDKKFTYVIKSSPASYFIKKAAGISKGSTKTGHEKVGSISLKHLYEIALIKQKDMPLASVEAVVKSLMGTCQSMGVNVVARPGDEAQA